MILAAVWLALSIHLLAALLVSRHLTTAPLIPALNLIVSILILAYWAHRWFGYLLHGIKWYGTDQLAPAYGVAICIAAVLALFGRYPMVMLNWIILAINGSVLVAAAFFFTFVRFDRLI